MLVHTCKCIPSTGKRRSVRNAAQPAKIQHITCTRWLKARPNRFRSLSLSLSIVFSVAFIIGISFTVSPPGTGNGFFCEVVPDSFQSFGELVLIGVWASGSASRSSPRSPRRSDASVVSQCRSRTGTQSNLPRVPYEPHQVISLSSFPIEFSQNLF